MVTVFCKNCLKRLTIGGDPGGPKLLSKFRNCFAVFCLTYAGVGAAQEYVALGTGPDGWAATARNPMGEAALEGAIDCGEVVCDSVYGPSASGCFASVYAPGTSPNFFVAKGPDLRGTYLKASESCQRQKSNCILSSFICHSTASVQSFALLELWLSNPNGFSSLAQNGVAPQKLQELQSCASSYASRVTPSDALPIPWPVTPRPSPDGASVDIAKWHYDFAAMTNESPMPKTNLGLSLMANVGMIEQSWFPCSTGN
ncbi:hypothetical protein [uncultured Roseobacter sp.]|uniref:hypothetical protein n=1 Tax=uncultured Roseobacter sp. TaxID=114847 RepID=UPI0026383044|nr:hypothetical protein [uncultured Roseobacter sp.]